MRVAVFFILLVCGHEALQVNSNIQLKNTVSGALEGKLTPQIHAGDEANNIQLDSEATAKAGVGMGQEHTITLNNSKMDNVKVTYNHRVRSHEGLWIAMLLAVIVMNLVISFIVGLFFWYFVGLKDIIKHISARTGVSQKEIKQAVVEAHKATPHMMSSRSVSIAFCFLFGTMLMVLIITAVAKGEIPKHFNEAHLSEPDYGGRTLDEMYDYEFSLSAAMDYDTGTLLGCFTSIIMLLLPLTESIRLGVKGGTARIMAASLVALLFGLCAVFTKREYDKTHTGMFGMLMVMMILYMVTVTHYIRQRYPRAPRFHWMLITFTLVTASMMVTTAFVKFAMGGGFMAGIGELASFMFMGFILACNSKPT